MQVQNSSTASEAGIAVRVCHHRDHVRAPAWPRPFSYRRDLPPMLAVIVDPGDAAASPDAVKRRFTP